MGGGATLVKEQSTRVRELLLRVLLFWSKEAHRDPSLTHLPRIISNAGATTKGEAGCRTTVSEPISLAGDVSRNINSLTPTRLGDCAIASHPEQH